MAFAELNPLPQPGELDLDGRLNVRIHRLASKMSLLATREVLADEKISISEWRLLVRLMEVGPCNMTQLSRMMAIGAGPVSRVAKRAEAEGLVTRTPDPKDKRIAIVEITSKGQRVFNSIWPRACNVMESFNNLYTAEERVVLDQLLERAHRKTMDMLADASETTET